MLLRVAARIGSAVLLCGFAVGAMAQASTVPTKIRVRRPEHANRHRVSSLHQGVGTRAEEWPQTPSDAAAQSPTITLRDGRLTVNAENADLKTILNGVAQASGMKIDGEAGNARVFGVYGPGNPRQVLTELLDGVGYNFMMVGDSPDGAPSELLLTAKSQAPPTAGAAMQKASGSTSDETDDDQGDQQPPGPGAIIHVPPSVAQQADESQTQERVQQNLQRLQRMRDGMQQQQQNQPQ